MITMNPQTLSAPAPPERLITENEAQPPSDSNYWAVVEIAQRFNFATLNTISHDKGIRNAKVVNPKAHDLLGVDITMMRPAYFRKAPKSSSHSSH